MTLSELRDRVRSWDMHNTGEDIANSKYNRIMQQLDYNAKKEWRQYLPAEHSDHNRSYMERLAQWISNVSDAEDQQLLLEYATFITFLSHSDFISLYRTAMTREVMRWLAQDKNVHPPNFDANTFHTTIYTAINRSTWFCPVTDSMDINEFYKVNHLAGIGHRPTFATLHMLSKHFNNAEIEDNIRAYMNNPSLRPGAPNWTLDRLVLLEDVVGSSQQCIDTVTWAAEALKKPVLFIPLVLCPNGKQSLLSAERKSSGMLTVKPIIELREEDLLGPNRNHTVGWPITERMEDLIRRTQRDAAHDLDDVFGYRTTGCSLVTFSNTPDNSIPMIHHRPRNHTWSPLFPRVERGNI